MQITTAQVKENRLQERKDTALMVIECLGFIQRSWFMFNGTMIRNVLFIFGQQLDVHGFIAPRGGTS